MPAAVRDVAAAEALLVFITTERRKRRVQAIKGRFQDSLVPGLAALRGMGPALYVDIDADLFSSTWTALDWLFREGLMKPGTVIGYVHYLHCLPA